MMEYKGYTGKITAVDEKQGILHGEVVGINDVVTFQGKTATELVAAFRDSVEDYLAFCEEEKEAPEKPFSGKFQLRIPADLHRKASLAAKRAGESLNSWVASAVRAHLGEGPSPRSESAGAGSGTFPEMARILALLYQLEGRLPTPLWRGAEFPPWAPFPAYPGEPDPVRSEVYRTLLNILQRQLPGGKGSGGASTSRLPQESAAEAEDTE